MSDVNYCTFCGRAVNSMEDRCPFCGHEYPVAHPWLLGLAVISLTMLAAVTILSVSMKLCGH